MITKVTKDNKGLYKALFENAGLAYQGSADEISSLDEYFACFKSLADLDQVFTVLPLDEPTFDIDANTRTITVPADFKKNGISVQGDQIAEIIYFTVDRYFDTTDLADDDINIIIQWETASNGKTTNKGISPAILKDTSIHQAEGKILFGWAINSNITEFSGTIKFSVRFYRTQPSKDDKNKMEITFSLSTLTATATVNPGLNYEFVDGVPSVQVFDDTATVKNRFKDSVIPDVNAAADEPVFLYNIPASEDECFNHIYDEEGNILYHLVDLQPVAGGPDSYTFKVQAASENGVVTYEWTKITLGSAAENSLDGVIEYILTEDTTYSSEKVYYTKKTSDGVDSYTAYSLPANLIGTEISEENKSNLYEKFSTLTATQTGDYKVVAVNRNGIAKATTSSPVVRIPGPEELSVSIPEGQENSYLTEGTVTLSATGLTSQQGDQITYVWTLDDEEVQTKVDDINVVNEYIIPTVEENERALYDKTFSVSVHASRNGDDTESQVLSFRVTDLAHAPIVSPNGTQFDIRTNGSLELSAKIQVDDIVADEITYTWYKMVVDDSEDLDNNDLENDLRLTEKDALAEYNKETKAVEDIKVTIGGSGTYYCVVTNHANGSSASAISERIRVSPV